jgi:Helix-turn-helix domain
MRLEPNDIRELAPLLRECVRQAVEEIAASDAKFGERLAYPEAEAAALLGVAKHTLRDMRLRGEISGKLAGKKMTYDRRELLRWLAERE